MPIVVRGSVLTHFAKNKENMEPKLYHIRLEVVGAFPALRCWRLLEEYCYYFSSFECAVKTAELLLKPLINKAQILGQVDRVEPVCVCQVEQNELPSESPFYCYGY